MEQDEPSLTSPNTKKRPREEPSNPDPTTYADTALAQSSSSAAAETPLAKRKRGRPTKAETEARRAAEARGEIFPKAKPYIPKTASPLVIGPDGQPKRRRGRPTKAETEARKAYEKEWKKKQQDEGQKQEEQEQQQEQQQTKEGEQHEEEDDEEEEDEDDE